MSKLTADYFSAGGSLVREEFSNPPEELLPEILVKLITSHDDVQITWSKK